jgi:branched-chain amino acid transport system permease protein
MLLLDTLVPTILNGLTMGAVYALIALGLTLIYGVLHIINFAHGSLMMAALYGVFFLYTLFGIDPYVALLIVPPAMFVVGYVLQWSVIGKAAKGKDENILLVTMGLSIVIENLALFFWRSDTRTIDTPYALRTIDLGIAILGLPKVISFFGALVMCALLWLFMSKFDTGRAIRAVATERHGAKLVGINVEHVFAVSFGLGCACLGIAACLLLPSYFVSPTVGLSFVLISFTVVVLGGMGSFVGALVGGLIVGITESLGGYYFGENLGQLGIFIIFIVILLVRPTGLFGKKA